MGNVFFYESVSWEVANQRLYLLAWLAVSNCTSLPILGLVCVWLAEKSANVAALFLTSNGRGCG